MFMKCWKGYKKTGSQVINGKRCNKCAKIRTHPKRKK